MGKLFLFMMVSLDGYFEGPDHDLSWHNVDQEFSEFAVEQTAAVSTLVFGRRTYEMMAAFWPTDQARDDPQTAELMNSKPKLVFSHTLKQVAWHNSRLAAGELAAEIQALKQAAGSRDAAVYGSSGLCLALLGQGLLDELRIMVNPVILGAGTQLFAGLPKPLKLQLLGSRTFRSGNVLLSYRPADAV
jgi:dihydrofolate reductase